MTTFAFTREWWGYSRGTDYIEVEAETVGEALEKLEVGGNRERSVVRDDTETNDWEQTLT